MKTSKSRPTRHERTNDRTVAYTALRGLFTFPPGLRFCGRNQFHWVEISTVSCGGAWLEDPFGWMGKEKGFETMIFLEDHSLCPVLQRHYHTIAQARKGHQSIVRTLKRPGRDTILHVTLFGGGWDILSPEEVAALKDEKEAQRKSEQQERQRREADHLIQLSRGPIIRKE